MENLFVYRILFSIEKEMSVVNLLALGLDYSQIAEFLSELINRKLLLLKDNNLVLSDSGKNMLENLSKVYSKENYLNWITPLKKYKIDKKEISDVYLPYKK
jgi:hypothetical protein